MFKNKPGTGKINPDTTDTLIGEGTIFEGKIRSEASIRIEGSIMGDIMSSGDVIIGENGVANSNINARDLILAGQLNGDADVRGKLTINSTGVLNGNISASSLIIESGGVFNGSSKMTAAKPEAVQPIKASS
ncbi:polymer-forming cytoskeletal protein [Paenibacillus sp. LHD-117]|uniref:bactofilin family protein n=1 Tax=Paenibacillus sp. LHD-117 TaxID=3071412 RepID=UPI0027DF6631|nr:polymer-forming cytoskeletal protein [Paenibacillus sp. LHD-117]MDQ6419729.1 polymer-forming cytoskeletal protein [Paenibacillus sp. LHD-117]